MCPVVAFSQNCRKGRMAAMEMEGAWSNGANAVAVPAETVVCHRYSGAVSRARRCDDSSRLHLPCAGHPVVHHSTGLDLLPSAPSLVIPPYPEVPWLWLS